MSDLPGPSTPDDPAARLLAAYPPDVLDLALRARAVVRELIPDAVEEVDPVSTLLGYTFRPGTYAGLILAIAPHQRHVNLVFAKGVELTQHDEGDLLEGDGKVARHLKVRSADRLDDPRARALVTQAAELTRQALRED